MNKVDELLAEFCPNGVPFHSLGELGKFYGGITGKSKDDFVDGNAKFITYKNVYSNPALKLDVPERVFISPEEKQRTLEYGDIVFTGSSETPDECGFSSVLTQKTNEKLYLNSFCFFFRFDDPSIFNPDFAKHLFRSDNLRYQIGKTASGVTRFNVSKKRMERVLIPVPPLPVQAEIVRILDNFTALTAELTAELTKRRQQYEHYRDRLLSFESKTFEVSRLTLGEATNVFRGEYITKSGSKCGNIPVILGGQEPAYYIDHSNHDGEIVVVARSGVSAGFVSYWNEPIFITDGFGFESKPDILLPKFLYHTLKNRETALNAMKQGAGVPHVSGEKLKQVKLLIPSLKKQKRIVEVLDNFDAICSDLNIGLPAEIDAQKKQYEYYRDLLLNFYDIDESKQASKQASKR